MVVTFLLGLGVGFTLCYALMDARNAKKTDTTLVVADDPGAPADIAPELSPNAAASPADVEGLWPAEHLFVGVSGRELDAGTQIWLKTFRPGGVILRPSNLDGAAQATHLIALIKEAVGTGTGLAEGPFVLTSQDGGPLNNLKATEAPSLAELGAAGNLDRTREIAAAYAAMARAQGFSGLLAPALDVFTPGVSRDAMESLCFSWDYEKVSNLGGAFIEGIRREGMLTVVKHYPGLGAAQSTPEGALANSSTDLQFIAKQLYPFEKAAKSGVSGILIAPIAVPHINEGAPKLPAMYSQKMVKTIIREQWGYKGVVLADDLIDYSSDDGSPIGNRVVEALMAGCDAVMLLDADAAILEEVCHAILSARDDGRLSEAQLAESKARLDVWRDVLTATAAREMPKPKPVPVAQPENTELLRHIVQANETLESLGKKYRVSVEDLKTWNGLTDDAIQAGQNLNVYIPKLKVVPPVVTPVPAESMPEPTEEPVAEPVPEVEVAAEPASAEVAAEDAPVVPVETPAVATAPPPHSVRVVYTVKSGETLTDLAESKGVKMADLISWNSLKSPELSAGQEIILYLPEVVALPVAPEPEVAAPAAPEPVVNEADYTTYTVKPGETLHRIALNHKMTAEALAKLNDLPRPDHVVVGQRLKVPKIAGE